MQCLPGGAEWFSIKPARKVDGILRKNHVVTITSLFLGQGLGQVGNRSGVEVAAVVFGNGKKVGRSRAVFRLPSYFIGQVDDAKLLA